MINSLTLIAGSSIVIIMIVMGFFLFLKGKSIGKKEILNKQNEQLVKNIKYVKKEIEDHRNDDIDTIRKRMRKYVRKE